jgi:nucleoside phosphorylase
MEESIFSIFDAARAGKRIDPPFTPEAVTILFDRHPEDVDIGEVQELLDAATEDHGVELRVIGGGAGCFRLIVVGKPIAAFINFLASTKFIRAAAQAGVTKIWSSQPGVNFPVRQGADAPRDSGADFAILTPLADEFRPLRSALQAAAKREKRIQNDGTVMTYYRYDIVADAGRTYSVVATFMPRMGNDSAAIATFHVINDWRPKYIVLTGVAGGLDRKDVSLGDVVIADEVFRFDRRRKERDAETVWAPNAYPTDRVLLNRASALLLEDDKMAMWARDCRTAFAEVNREPEGCVGNLACGDAVVDSQKLKTELKRLNRTLTAIEMEGGGFIEAIINQTAVAKALVVRGISDFAADKSTTDSDTCNWRGFAARNAATFVVRFIQQFQTGTTEMFLSHSPSRG